ncbi:MAG: hypothetical protein Q8R47_03025 [Nanoarchaeota archaeon]|nr:hypothetical protein [Nanoarchaeota archaeon]
MAYSWDAELVGEVKSRQQASSFHETDFLRGYVKTQASHTYLPAPKLEDYLTLSLREGSNISKYESTKPVNTAYGRTGNYDIASKLGLYNSADSIDIDAYSPKRNSYQKEKDNYLI